MQNNSRIVVSVLAILCIGIAYYLLSATYGETSERGYSYAMVLISACNLKDEERVRHVQSMLKIDLEKRAIGDSEAAWLSAIIDHALAGDWDIASRHVRKLMNAQVKRA